MLARREPAPQPEEGTPQPEEDPSDRWSLVIAVTSYALKTLGLEPQRRYFLANSHDDEMVREMLIQEYLTVDFANLPLEIYPLHRGEPTDLDRFPKPKPRVIEVPDARDLI